MKRFLIFCGFILLGYSAKSQIIAGEYFWDTDPGVGLGIQLSAGEIASGTSDESYNFSAIAPNTSSGQHVLFVRFKQNDTLWSQAYPQLILISPENLLSGSATATDTAKVVSIQYYFNNDDSNVLTSSLSNYDAQFNFNSTINTAGLAEGNHILNFRVRDKFGFYSPWGSRSILILGTTPAPNISKIEHWLDDSSVIPRTIDPHTPASSADVSTSFEIPTSGLSTGLHVFNIQAISAVKVLPEKSGSDSSAIGEVAILIDPQYSLVSGATYLSNNTASSEFCLGGTIKVAINQTGSWPSQNAFKLQLSDNIGNNFVDIATSINSTQDTLIGTIPSNVMVSSGYKTRAVATFPYIRSESATVLTLGITATATATQATLCEGATLALSSTTSVAASYSWSGPSGFSPITQNPTRTNILPGHSGDYILTATSTAAGCVARDTVVVTANALPMITLGSNSPVCEGQTLNLTSSSVGNTLISWTKNGSALSGSGSNRNISNVQMSNGGYYKVGYSSPAGCQKFDSVNVIVKVTPFIAGLTNNPTVCEGVAVNMGVNQFPSATYLWTGPNAFTNSSNSFSFNAAQSLANKSGTYKVKASLNGCVDSTTTLLTINALPVITMGSNSPLCVGQTLNLTSSSTNGAFLAWSKSSTNIGGTSGNKSITNVVLSDSGYYKVAYLSTASCLKIDSIKVTVKANPVLGTVSNNSPICSGNNLTIGYEPVVGQTYAWTGPNAFTSSNSAFSISSVPSNAGGTYSLTVTQNGCNINTTALAVVNQTPTANTTSPVVICQNQPLSLVVNNTPSATYLWSGPFFAAAGQNPLVSNTATVGMSGTYSVMVTLGSCNASNTVAVTVKPLPVISGTNTNSPICSGNNLNFGIDATAGSTYSWTGPNSFTSALEDPNITSAATNSSGTYSVTVSLNGCNVNTTVVNVVNLSPTVSTTTPVAICQGAALTLNVNNTPSATYGWSGPSGFSSIIENPLVSNTATLGLSGTYSVSVTLGSCSANGTVAVTVNPNPVLVITNQNTPGNGPVNITVPAATTGSTLPSGTILSYFTNLLATNALSTPAAVANSGTYYIKATSLAGCTDLKPIVVNICGSTFNLVSPTDDYSTGLQVKASNVKITAANKITGTANITFRSAQAIELSPGFLASSGTVFLAERGVCN